MTLEIDRESVLSRELHNFALDQGIVGADGRALIAWPGRHFDPASVPGDAQRSDGPNANIYLRVDSLPVPPDVRGITSGWAIYRYIQQVSIYTRVGLGITRAFELAEALRTTFPTARRLTGEHTYTVTGPAAVAAPIQNDGWMAVPVSIPLIVGR